MTEPKTEPSTLALSFTVEEWRLIAVACTKIKGSQLMNPQHKGQLQAIAYRIAHETGKPREPAPATEAEEQQRANELSAGWLEYLRGGASY